MWNDLTEKMGYWVDMEDPYVTYKPNIWKRFGGCLQIYNKDLMYKGSPFSFTLKSRNRIELSE
jgi:isoleucyl-tRNA synthetase